MHRYLTASQLVALELHGSLNFNGDIAGWAWQFGLGRLVVRLCCAFPVGNANLSYRCILAGVDSHCLLSAFRQHHQCSTRSPSPHFSSPRQANLSQLFECLFVNFLARKVCCKILCANIVFACFCCAKRQRPPLPSLPPALPTSPAAQSCWRKLYQCASVFSGVSLPSFFLSFLLAVVCLLLTFFCFRLAFRHVLAFSALICIVFAHFVVACSVFVVASVLRATCNAAASFLCIRFYFIAISLKRKLEKLHEIFVVPPLVVFYFQKVFKSIVPSSW